jgi:methionyl-tRNA formyltransferase
MDGDKEIARLTLLRAKPSDSKSTHPPGSINSNISITGGDGYCLHILEVQPEGKRPMLLADFRNGRPWNVGMHIQTLT